MTAALGFDLTDVQLRRSNSTVVDDLNLASGPGVIGVLGPNGSGKTTLLRALATIQQPSRGTLSIAGHSVAAIQSRRSARFNLGYSPQEPQFPARLRAIDAVDLIAVMKEIGPGRRARLTKVWHAIDAVDLRDQATERLGTLSGGMRHRVAVAQAMVGDPKLLILDEPMASLDPEQRLRLGVNLRRRAPQATVVIATHLIDDVVGVCDRVLVLDRGKVVFDGTAHSLAAMAAGLTWELGPEDDAPPGSRPMPNGNMRALGNRPVGGVAVPPDPADGYRTVLAR